MIEKVSVVITAHNRKKYLLEAVNSVLHQVNPGVEIEIVVVKNFVDDKIDSFLMNSGAVNIYTDEESFGGKLSLGIDASSGNIICFLDDDDMFNPVKIGLIRKIFDENKGLLFVHNDIQIISEETTWNTARATNEEATKFKVYSSEKLSGREWGKILSSRADWYVSCASMDAPFAKSISQIVYQSNRSLDKILFLLGTGKEASFGLCKNRLTMYRKHESITGLKTDVTDFRNRRLKFTKESIENLRRTFKSYIKGVNNLPYNYMLLKMEGNLAIYDKYRRGKTFRIMTSELKHFIRYGGEEYALLSMLLFLNIFSNRLSIRVFRYIQIRDI